MPGSAAVVEAHHYGPWLTGIMINLGFPSLGLMASMTLFAAVTWITPELHNPWFIALIGLIYAISTAVYMWQYMETIRLFGRNGIIVVMLIALILVVYLIVYGASIIPLSMALITLGLFASTGMLADFLKIFQDMKDEHMRTRGSVTPQGQRNELDDQSARSLPMEHALPGLRDHGWNLTPSLLKFVTDHTGPSELDHGHLRRDSLSSRVSNLVLSSTGTSTTPSIIRYVQIIDGRVSSEEPDDNAFHSDSDDHHSYQNITESGVSLESRAHPG